MNAALRRRVRVRAAGRCEYCRIHENDEPYTFHVEHIMSRKHGGASSLSNLAWSCHSCNLSKGANVAGLVKGQLVALFHPRRQDWTRHFHWNGPLRVAKTKCGRATIQVLNINDDARIELRAILIAAGAFPLQ
jgi:hypothetical protein